MSSSSEEEENYTQYNTNKDWQKLRSTKRIRTLKQHPSSTNEIQTTNRFNPLLNQSRSLNNEINAITKISKPPPIFVHGVQNYSEIIKHIKQIAEQEQYVTKSLANNVVKINCETPETYKKMVREFKAQQIYHRHLSTEGRKSIQNCHTLFTPLHQHRTHKTGTGRIRTQSQKYHQYPSKIHQRTTEPILRRFRTRPK
jgi:3-methyladenine DNA glycosylase AlkC